MARASCPCGGESAANRLNTCPLSALRLNKRNKKQVVSSHEGTKGTKVFWGHGWPQVASRGSRVNFSYCNHAVARNLESKSSARVFNAEVKSVQMWHGHLARVIALCAEFAVRIEDLGVFTSAFYVQAWHGHLARVSWAGRPCHFSPLTSYLLLTSYFRLPLFYGFHPALGLRHTFADESKQFRTSRLDLLR